MNPESPQPPTLTMENILSSVELEQGILDVDGRVPRSERIAANDVTSINYWGDVSTDIVAANRAAKSLSIWRWSDEVKDDRDLQMVLDRGARELVGTVYYLRRA